MLRRLGKTIREQRVFLGMDQGSLAKAAGVGISTIGRAGGGENISIETMLAICIALDLTPAVLWDLVKGRDFFSMNSKGEVAK